MLGNYWPGPRALFYSLASDIALAFLTAYPNPVRRQRQRRLQEPAGTDPHANLEPRAADVTPVTPH